MRHDLPRSLFPSFLFALSVCLSRLFSASTNILDSSSARQEPPCPNLPFPLDASPYITRARFLSPPTKPEQASQAIDSSKPSKVRERRLHRGFCRNQFLLYRIMDKVLAFSILSASPADIAPGAGAIGGGTWARLSWRGMKQDDQTAGAEQHLEKEKSQAQAQHPPARRPRFAPEFDGIDCFETIVWRY